MQFNFLWFTSNPTLNLIIATAIWFVLVVACMNVCKRGGDEKPGALAYIGYALQRSEWVSYLRTGRTVSCSQLH